MSNSEILQFVRDNAPRIIRDCIENSAGDFVPAISSPSGRYYMKHINSWETTAVVFGAVCNALRPRASRAKVKAAITADVLVAEARHQLEGSDGESPATLAAYEVLAI